MHLALSPRTRQAFAQNLGWIRRNPAYDGRRPAALASQVAQHHAYRARFDAAVVAVTAMDERNRRSALRILAALGEIGCRSGTMEFASSVAALARLGLADANNIFDGERAVICNHFLAGIATVSGERP